MVWSSNRAHENGEALTESIISDTRPTVGRKKQWDARVNVTLTKTLKDRIALALEPGEVTLDLIRQAIESELKRRERTSAKPKP